MSDRTPGGMGAYSPVPSVPADVESRIWSQIVAPTVEALRAEGSGFRGLLYAGLMLTADGPKVVEFNCRFGDPETEVVVPRLRSDLAELLLACATDRLADVKVDWLDDAAVTVVLASGGYPGRLHDRCRDPRTAGSRCAGVRFRVPCRHNGAGR